MRSYKHRRGTVRTILSVLLVLCIPWFSLSVGAESLYELRQKQDQLKAEKEASDARLADLKNDIAQKKLYRDELFSRIDTVQNQLDTLRKQIVALNEEIREAEAGIAQKQESINENFSLLKDRIRTLYLRGEASNIAIVLNSRTLMDYTQKAEVLKAVAAHDKRLIEMLADQLKEIEDTLKEIKANKAELSERKTELDEVSDELTEYYDEVYRVIEELEGEAALVNAHSDNLGHEMEEIEASIKELEEEIKKNQGSMPSGGFAGTGYFIWPMPGYSLITCYFGQGGHRGIDIAGGGIYGKPVVAADGGYVTYAGWHDSYGYCVFINHGNGYETRYAHMSALATDTGAVVGQGEIIGYCGSTGNSTGPHLHFEVIYNGSLVNPFNFFG